MEGENEMMAHVLMVSFPSQGNVNPLLRFAKQIASKGLLVTFTSSNDVGHKIYACNNVTPGSSTPIGKGLLRFEFFPDGWEANDPRSLPDLDLLILHLKTVGTPAVADIIRRQAELGRPVSCVVSNPLVSWVIDVASDMNIPSGMLWVQSCAVYSTYYHYHHRLAQFPTVDHPDTTVVLPGLPVLKPDDLPTCLLPTDPFPALRKGFLGPFENLSKATWVFLNTFEELEPDAISKTSALSPVIPVGPLVEVNGDEVRGDLCKAADCMEWLDSQEPGSVVYVSMGSLVVLSREEMTEMAYGLRNSRRPFLWVVRKGSQESLPEGYVEETKGQGMVVGWSPQERVLGHGSVGCFLTHCGWNSTLEVLSSGVPVIAYPECGDQVTDAMFLVEVYRVGVRLRERFGREELERCIKEVVEGPEAEEMKRRALDWKVKARKAVAEGGSSDRNIQDFVDEVRSRAGGVVDV